MRSKEVWLVADVAPSEIEYKEDIRSKNEREPPPTVNQLVESGSESLGFLNFLFLFLMPVEVDGRKTIQ